MKLFRFGKKGSEKPGVINKNGDKIEIEIEKLGRIQNTVKFLDHN